jgi:hypothetical protein
MKPNVIKLLEMCIQDGLASGWHRAHQQFLRPSPDEIQEAQQNAIMGEIWEWFDMGESDEH